MIATVASVISLFRESTWETCHGLLPLSPTVQPACRGLRRPPHPFRIHLQVKLTISLGRQVHLLNRRELSSIKLR